MILNFKKAQKGNTLEMEKMYRENAASVYFMLTVMLGTGSEIENATAGIFKRVLPLVLNKTINNEEELTSALTKETAKYCKKVLDKKYKAFRILQSRNYSQTSYDKANVKASNSIFDTVLDLLPQFHKFVYLLKYAYGYNESEIAGIIKTKKEIIEVILKSEDRHLAGIYRAANAKNPKLEIMESDKFHRELSLQKDNTQVPDNVAKTVCASIYKWCQPIRAKEKKKIIKISIAAISVFLIMAITAGICVYKNNAENTEVIGEADAETNITLTDSTDTETTELSADEEISHYADIEIENYGTITVALYGNTAPETVENFVNLANGGFYDGLTFHRIMDGFMMQGGDPNGDGTGGSDENVVGEFSENGYENNISHTRGTISMARSSDYDSGSSQFFIVHEDSTFLDGQYAAFGQVTEGMDIVDEICTSANPTDDNGTISKEEQPVISSITIRQGGKDRND